MVGSQRQALLLAGVSRGTWQYRQRPRARVTAPIRQADRAYPSRISETDRARIKLAWAAGESVDWAFATAWDAGVMLASRRSWWRVGASIEDQVLRPSPPKKTSHRGPRAAPVLTATGPGQVWSWDITDLYSPWRGTSYKAYKIIDVFSREIMGYRVEHREADHLAVELFEDAIREHGAPRVVHADNGATMTSTVLRDLLRGHGAALTFNRPYVSNDNPFSEAAFKTMKYRPGYPRIFATLEDARAYVAGYVGWYNTSHKHTGIALFSPAEVGDGSWERKWEIRDRALQAYYDRHPARFARRPRTPSPATLVGINHRKPQTDQQPSR